jgi:hypothetical protein
MDLGHSRTYRAETANSFLVAGTGTKVFKRASGQAREAQGQKRCDKRKQKLRTLIDKSELPDDPFMLPYQIIQNVDATAMKGSLGLRRGF